MLSKKLCTIDLKNDQLALMQVCLAVVSFRGVKLEQQRCRPRIADFRLLAIKLKPETLNLKF